MDGKENIKYKRKKDKLYYTNRHSCFLLQYHMVLVTKYRKPVLQGKVKESVYNIIKDLCDERGYRILEINGEPDHVHLLFETGPDMSPMEFANVVKTKTARFTRRDYPKEVGKYYWKPYFWTDSYFVTTVGTNSRAVVQDYIKNQ